MATRTNTKGKKPSATPSTLAFTATSSTSRAPPVRRKAAAQAAKALQETSLREEEEDDDEEEAVVVASSTRKRTTTGNKAAGGGGGGGGAKKKARVVVERDADEGGDDDQEEPSSSSLELEQLARKVKAKQAKAAQAKKTAFETEARKELARMQGWADHAVKKHDLETTAVLGMYQSLATVEDDGLAMAWQSLDDAELGIFATMLEALSEALPSEEGLNEARTRLESRQPKFRKQSKAAVQAAKSSCHRELELYKVHAESKAFCDKYQEMMSAVLG